MSHAVSDRLAERQVYNGQPSKRGLAAEHHDRAADCVRDVHTRNDDRYGHVRITDGTLVGLSPVQRSKAGRQVGREAG